MNQLNNGMLRKTIVNYLVIIFGLIIILIFILLSIYYVTPNNYILKEWNKNKFKFENKNEYIIKPDTTLLIDTNSNRYLRFSEQCYLIVKNSFKSQTININKNIELIKSKNSEIYIINNTNNEIKIIVEFYI